MTRFALISKLILAVIFSGFLLAGQPIEAKSPPTAETVGNQEAAERDDSIDSTSGQVAVPLNRDEINSIAEALPEGEVRLMFNKKVVTGAEKNNASSNEGRPTDPLVRVRSGEEFSVLFTEGVKAVSHAQKQLYSFLVSSTFNSREWAAALGNVNKGKGFGHLILTFIITALLIFAGLGIEWLVRRATGGLRRQILDTASLGRLQFLGRVVSRLFLNILGLSTYILSTFMLCALIYDEPDPGYLIVSATLLPSYYIRFFILAANRRNLHCAYSRCKTKMPDSSITGQLSSS
jgi:hypothetical protein